MGVLVPVRAQVARLVIPSALPARWATTCLRLHPGSPDGSAAQASDGGIAASNAASLAASAARSVRGVADMPSTLPAGNRSGPAGKQLSDTVVRVAGSAQRQREEPTCRVGRPRAPTSARVKSNASPATPPGRAFEADRLVVRGAREHNLKDISLDLPRNALIVFTGLSGSGKSSLAFDTIFAEGQRRYVESLSAYARQFLGQMDKPDVDFIEGLSPAVSIDQKSTSRNPRSTVGTITEVYDYLRLLYARVGRPHCPVCGKPIARQTPQQIVDQLLALGEGVRFQVLAPVIRGRKGEYLDLFRQLQAQGYARARVDGTVHALTEVPKLNKQKKHTIEVVVDRLAVKAAARQRLTDSIETALGLGGGIVVLDFVDLPESDPQRERTFSEHLACSDDGLSFEELEPRSFSFNSPYGACPDCHGLGTRMEVDPELVVSDPSLSLADGAVTPWAGAHTIELLRSAARMRLPTRWASTSTSRSANSPSRCVARSSKASTSRFTFGTRTAMAEHRSYYTTFEGVIPYVQRRHAEAETDTSRERFEGYMRQIPCATCEGARLKPIARAVTIGDRSIAEVASLPIGDAADFLRSLELTSREEQIAARVLKEVNERLRFLIDVGLHYLTLDRAAGTLAGGEAQRIRLATQIGSGLVGVLYVLDEPSIGLHQRDNHRLIETLVRLRDLGNTLIVVEHDEDTIASADWVVDIGPGAGEHGGQIVVSGPLSELLDSPDSLTGAYLSGRRSYRDTRRFVGRSTPSGSSRSTARARTTCRTSRCRSRSVCSPRSRE